ncbi:MAG: inositol monophosphatase family protein [archaeon]
MSIELEVAKTAANEAGKILLKRFDSIHSVSFKTAKDTVTETDLAAEKKIISILGKNFPSHSFHAEESGKSREAADYVWVIDPLDGTVNYSHGIPIFGISIALQFSGKIIAGVISLPSQNELFYAEKGKGAFLNGKRINVSAEKNLSHALCYFNDFNIGNDSERKKFNSRKFKIAKALAENVMRYRILGSAATELAYLASGRIDAYGMSCFGFWDAAAGKILVEEAGGTITDSTGKEFTEKSREFIASNGKLHAKFLGLLKKA